MSESGIVARVIRVHSKQHHDAASMRVELLGCLHGGFSVYSSLDCMCFCAIDIGHSPEALVSGDVRVTDARMTASSYVGSNTAPHNARIDSYNGWQPEVHERGEWIQVIFHHYSEILIHIYIAGRISWFNACASCKNKRQT